MKTLHLGIITAIGIVVAITSGIFLINYQSYKPMCIEGRLPNGTCAGPVAIDIGITDSDLSHATTENPLGIKAQVIIEKDTLISCIKKCNIPPTPHLVLISEKGAQFVGYQACDGISCQKDNLDNSLYVRLAQVPDNYSGITSFEASHINLGDLPWNIGDTVHVLVKAFPVTLQQNGTVIREQEKISTIDLGESTITGNNVSSQQLANSEQQTSQITTVIIPQGVELANSGKNYEPQYLHVVIGVNNTVKWINDGIVPSSVIADNQNDQDFFNATNKKTDFNSQGSKLPNFLKSGESFQYTFNKTGYFGYHSEPHPWMRGWILVLPQDTDNLLQTVVLNDTDIIGPCAIFAIPCPNTHTFTAQKLGTNIYIEKMTINGVDNYVIVNPEGYCVYTNSYRNSCTNSVDLAILRLVGAE